MKTTDSYHNPIKRYTDLYSVDEFLAYYHSAGRRELKAILKGLGNNHLDQRKKHLKQALIALLA